MTRYLTTRQVRVRYGDCSEMTVWRWVRDGILPQPVYMNGRKYWPEEELDQHDAKSMTDSGRAE